MIRIALFLETVQAALEKWKDRTAKNKIRAEPIQSSLWIIKIKGWGMVWKCFPSEMINYCQWHIFNINNKKILSNQLDKVNPKNTKNTPKKKRDNCKEKKYLIPKNKKIMSAKIIHLNLEKKIASMKCL